MFCHIGRTSSESITEKSELFFSMKALKQIVHSAFPYFPKNTRCHLRESWDFYFDFWSRFRFRSILVMVLDSLIYKCRTNFHSFQVYVSSQKCMNTANHVKKICISHPSFSPGAFGWAHFHTKMSFDNLKAFFFFYVDNGNSNIWFQ